MKEKDQIIEELLETLEIEQKSVISYSLIDDKTEGE